MMTRPTMPTIRQPTVAGVTPLPAFECGGLAYRARTARVSR